MAIRDFKLRNGNGTVYNLTTKPSFLHSVAGLGYETDTEYQRIGNQFKILSDRIAQGKITGVVHFGSNKPQKEYQDFIKFLQIKPITMYYTPYGLNDTYYRDGTVTEVTYEEEDTLSAEVTFTPTTMPYKIVIKGSSPEQLGDSTKRYSYGYNYQYRNTPSNTLEIMLTEDTPSGVTLSMEGILHNPVWKHYVDGVLYATGKYNGTVGEHEILTVDSTNVPYSITLENQELDTVTDVYENCDFATERFIELQYGINTIVIEDDLENGVYCDLMARVYYASV